MTSSSLGQTMDESQSTSPQDVDGKANDKGRIRVKPRQLSPLLKRLIVDQFMACRSTEDIAEELRIPARTVSDVLLAEALRRQPEPERGFGLPLLRRSVA